MFLEIIVTFQDPTERDYYYSKAKNLAQYRDDAGNPTAGLRMDIAPYLLPTFKLLNSHGYEIKLKNGNETRRYVKFDEDNLSLYLEVRLPGQQKWIRIKPEQARSYTDEKDRIAYVNIRRSLLTSSSSTNHQDAAPSQNPNPNLLPLGTRSRSQHSDIRPLTQSVPTIEGRRPRWIPPGKDAPGTSNSRGSV